MPSKAKAQNNQYWRDLATKQGQEIKRLQAENEALRNKCGEWQTKERVYEALEKMVLEYATHGHITVIPADSRYEQGYAHAWQMMRDGKPIEHHIQHMQNLIGYMFGIVTAGRGPTMVEQLGIILGRYAESLNDIDILCRRFWNKYEIEPLGPGAMSAAMAIRDAAALCVAGTDNGAALRKIAMTDHSETIALRHDMPSPGAPPGARLDTQWIAARWVAIKAEHPEFKAAEIGTTILDSLTMQGNDGKPIHFQGQRMPLKNLDPTRHTVFDRLVRVERNKKWSRFQNDLLRSNIPKNMVFSEYESAQEG